MSESNSKLKRLRLRSWRRGTREMDLILGPFADAKLAVIGSAALEAYEALIDQPDHDIYLWVSGGAAAPVQHHQTLALIRSFHGLPEAGAEAVY